MNKIYKIVWNEVIGAWVATSELAKGRSKNSAKKMQTVSLLITAMGLAFTSNQSFAEAGTESGTNSGMETSTAISANCTTSQAQALGNYSIALGCNANAGMAGDDNSIAIGKDSSSRSYGIALGLNATAAKKAIAQGASAKALYWGDIAIGANANASSEKIQTVGYHSATAIGKNAVARFGGATALGDGAKATNQVATAIGSNANAYGAYGTSVGFAATAVAGSTALGAQANASGSFNTSVGFDSTASRYYSSALGYNAKATGISSTAIGSEAISNNENAVAVGYKTKSGEQDTVAVGSNSNASKRGSVALGSKSTTVTDAINVTSVTVNGLTYGGFSGAVASTGSQISLGNVGDERQIKNMAAGQITSTSTDAINGSQLYVTNSVLANVAQSTKNVLGGTAAVDENGNLSITNIGGTGKDNINDAIAASKTDVEHGKNIQVTSMAGKDGQTIYNVSTADDVDFNKITVGDVTITPDGLVISKGPSITNGGVNAGGQIITNVATPTNNTDAANKKYVDDATNAATSKGFALQAADGAKVQKNLGEAVEVVGADSNITTKVIGGQVAIELNKNLNNLTGITVNDGTNGTNGSTVIGKDGISVTDGSGNTIASVDNTALTVKDGNGNTETSINQAINTLNAVQGETDKFAVKYDKNTDGSVNYNNVTLAGTNGTTISNVKAGAVTSTSTDAINGSQLYGVASSVKNAIGGSTTIDTTTGAITTTNIGGTGSNTIDGAINSIKDSATKAKSTVSAGNNVVVTLGTNADGSSNYEVATAKDLTVDSVKAGDTVLNNAGISIGNNAVVINNTGLTIAGGPSVTVAGINAGNKTITNVANAVNATDAVNKGQLDSAIGTVDNNVNELANNAVKYDDASKDKITLGGGTNGTTISNVKDGDVSQGSKDAVNGGQLWNVQQQVDQNSTDISNIKNDINNGTVGLVQQAGKDATVTVAKDTGGTSVSVAGTDGNRVVTGVKDGAVNATSKDAVNGSQLNTTNQAVVNYLGAGYDNITGSFTAPTYNVGDSKYNNVGGAIDALNQADQALNSKIDNVSNKLDNAFRITNNRIDDVVKKANAGIAAAMALESAPYIPGKYTYAAGAAYHGGENAVGVTLRKTADNGRWSITGGVAAASQGDPSVRIGISGVID